MKGIIQYSVCFETYARPCYFLSVSHPIECKFTTFRWKHKWLDTNTEHIWRLPEAKICTQNVLSQGNISFVIENGQKSDRNDRKEIKSLIC